MGAGHRVHVEKFTAGSGLPLKGTAIPGSSPQLMPMAVRSSDCILRVYLGRIGLCLGRTGTDTDGRKDSAGKDCGPKGPMRVGCDSGHCSPVLLYGALWP